MAYNNNRSIRIVPYNPQWPLFYNAERTAINEGLAGHVFELEHVGSTSVPGLGAKPTVDIMLGLFHASDFPTVVERLQSLGYIWLPDEFDKIPGRYDFVFKDHFDERQVNLHIVDRNGVFWNRHLIFRDFLRQNKTPLPERTMKI